MSRRRTGMGMPGSLALAILMLCLASCVFPASSTRVVDESPGIVVQGASETAMLVVDGVTVGRAADYSGKYSLSVLPGRHVVEVREGGAVVLRQEIYVSEGATKTLTVPGGGG